MKDNHLRSLASRVLLTLTAAVLVSPIAAQATCTINGPIIRVTTYDDSYKSTGCYIYQRTNAVESYYFRIDTDDDDMCTNAVVAATSGVDVMIEGSATSCPTTGTARHAGRLNYLIINP